MLQCPRCQAILPDGSAGCGKCGARFKKKSDQQRTHGANTQINRQTSTTTASAKNKKTIFPIILVASLCIVGIASFIGIRNTFDLSSFQTDKSYVSDNINPDNNTFDKPTLSANNKKYNYDDLSIRDKPFSPIKNRDGKWGYLNRLNELVIPYKFDYAADTFNLGDGGYGVVINEDGSRALIDSQGQEIFSSGLWNAISYPQDGLILYQPPWDGEESPVGFLNMDGEIAIEARYLSASLFNNGVAVVEEVTGYYEEKSFNGGVHTFPEIKYGVIDRKGNYIVAPIYDKIGDFSEGLAAIILDEKVGFINEQGEIVIEPKFLSQNLDISNTSFHNERAAVIVDRFTENGITVNKYGYIDKKGDLVINPIYSGASDFSDGIAGVIIYQEGETEEYGSLLSRLNYAYIDVNGTVLLEANSLGIPTSEHRAWRFYDFSDGFGLVYEYDEFYEYYGHGDIFYIDKDGNKLQPESKLMDAQSFIDGYALVRDTNGVQHLMDTTGKFAYTLEYGTMIVEG